MNVMMIVKRKPKVGSKLENDRRADSASGRLNPALSTCRTIYPFINGIIENNLFPLYSWHKRTSSFFSYNLWI